MYWALFGVKSPVYPARLSLSAMQGEVEKFSLAEARQHAMMGSDDLDDNF